VPKRTDSNYPETPELEKMRAYAECSQNIGEFIDWLTDEKRVVFALWDDDGDTGERILIPTCLSMNVLLAEFYNLDLDKIEEERRAILDYIHNKYKEEKAPPVKIVVTAEDTTEEMEIKGE